MLLMMGKVVPEICWAYKKYNKRISSIYLVLILQFKKKTMIRAWKEVAAVSLQLCANTEKKPWSASVRIFRVMAVSNLALPKQKSIQRMASEAPDCAWIWSDTLTLVANSRRKPVWQKGAIRNWHLLISTHTEDGTDRLSRNVGKQLPQRAA